MELLEDSISPFLQNFKLESTIENTFGIVPNYEELLSVKKNSPILLHILFPEQPDELRNIHLEFSCFDP